jgi:hypothetical protein
MSAGELPSAMGAEMLADLVAVLIPGGNGWPSAAAVGVQGFLATRLMETQGDEALERLIAALQTAGGPFAGRDENDHIGIVAAFERNEPELFDWVRDAVFIAYYESPFVAAAIAAKGHPYKLRPHLSGYRVPRFDPALHAPKMARGHYVPTDQVKKVNTAALDLEVSRTARWGRSR